ncbi:LytR/AlgR family response regulator transcription factor [Bacteroides fragilis]|uniref:Response regulator transcription factor n=2 Tax=Bacteroides fragilis TaxID=817 RepID=A0AAP9SUB3_BACFG|nr:LytTR family DNA-binding domain-containing protein [Bacteroides fragilis]EFR53514.1 LytTr DNA-binding domain protein [Bacteroides fragilis 3_1_12]MBM6511804.1 response regulator transcription factor [Bacteroides fragilis]QKH83206.1 response regulator transcription factor [Bacteroides fragilis]
MNKITAVIIEDEIPAARRLNKIINKIRPEWQVTILPGSVEKSVEWFNKNPHPDIVFLDIQLTDGISFTFIEQARPESTIIFTTAYDEYAIRAFAVNSIDYLLKPIDSVRLEEAIAKFEHLTTKYLVQEQKTTDLIDILQNIANPCKKYRTRFLISGEDKLFTLQVEDIAYFYSENKITFAVTKQNREHIIDLSLDRLMEQLNPDIFFRSSRQTVISINAIERIESYFLGKAILHVKPPFKDKIIVSRDKIPQLKLWLNY